MGFYLPTKIVDLVKKLGQSKKLAVRRESEFGIEVDVVSNREHKSGHQPPSKYAMLRI